MHTLNRFAMYSKMCVDIGGYLTNVRNWNVPEAMYKTEVLSWQVRTMVDSILVIVSAERNVLPNRIISRRVTNAFAPTTIRIWKRQNRVKTNRSDHALVRMERFWQGRKGVHRQPFALLIQCDLIDVWAYRWGDQILVTIGHWMNDLSFQTNNNFLFAKHSTPTFIQKLLLWVWSVNLLRMTEISLHLFEQSVLTICQSNFLEVIFNRQHNSF